MFQAPETKIKQNKGFFQRLSVLVTLFFIVAVGIFAIPGLSYANTCTPSGGAGVDQGANMYTCTGGLSVSFNPAQPKLGDTVNFTIGLMNSTDQNDFKSMGADLQIWVKSGSWFSQDQSIFTKSFTGNTIQDKFIAGGSAFSQAGSYTLHIEMSYQVTGAISQMYSFAQDNQITVLAADNTGGPKLNVTASESFADGPNITKGLSWSYSDGGSGKQAASYKVDCGDSKGIQNVPSGQTSFRCVYGTNAQNYTAKVYAYDASGTQLAVQGATLTVTGNESTQGAGQNGTSTDTTLGGAVKGLISLVVGFVLGIIQELIYGIFYLLIVPLMQAMLSIRTYTDTFASVIYPGWVVLRNLCNIIFIVAIMVIAMGTLLRVDSYKSRSVLVQLILAALLVNFSLVIGQVVLGLADTVQNQFLPNNQDVIRALGKDLMVAYRSDVFNLKLTGYFSDIVKQIMFLILACGSFMVFLAIAAFLFIRIIMLWILLMLSPLAYAAGALPSTAHYRTEWWTTFLKYAFFTPIMAFFLNMTAIISNTYKTNPIFGTLGVKDSDFGDSSLAGFVFRVGSTLLLIVFLIVALKVAESFSIFGAGEISKFAKGGMFFPLKAAKVGAGMVERTYAKNLANAKEKAEESGQKNKARALRALQFLSPTTVKEAWKQRQHELHEEAFLGATGDVRDTLNRVMPTEWNQWSNLAKGKLPHLGRRTKYGLIGRRQLINIKKKEWENIPASEEEKVELESQAVHPEDMEAWNLNLLEGRHEDGRRIALLAKRRQEKEDELFETYKQQGIEERAARIRAQKEVRDENNENYVAVEYDAIRDLMDVYERFRHHGKNAHEMGRIAAHVDEEAEGQNKFRQMGFGVWEEHEGAFRLASDFEGYKTLEDTGPMGKLKMLESLYGTGIFTAKKEDYEEVDLKDGSPPHRVLKQVRFKFKNKETGETDERVITNYSDLDKYVKKQDEENYSDESGGNLRYQLTGARMAGSRQKRIERGNFEDKIKGLEPASMMVMDEHGKFTRFTSSGALTWKKLPAMAATVLAQSRQAQARIMKFVGIYASDDEKEVIDVQPFSETNSDGTMYDVMAESFVLNGSAANGVIQKAKIASDSLDKMVANLQAYYDSDIAKEHFHNRQFQVIAEKDKDGKTTGIKVEQRSP